MIIHTMAEGISAARKLEDDSAAFYAAAAVAQPELAAQLQAFARENQKSINQIEQIYHSSVTDAIETNFTFDLETDGYRLEDSGEAAASRRGLIETAIRNEEKVQQFYLIAAEQSKSLMADISRSFVLAAKKKKARLVQLAELLSV